MHTVHVKEVANVLLLFPLFLMTPASLCFVFISRVVLWEDYQTTQRKQKGITSVAHQHPASAERPSPIM